MALQWVKLIVINVICSKIAKMPDLPTPLSVKIPKPSIPIHAKPSCHEAFGTSREKHSWGISTFCLKPVVRCLICC